MGRDIHAPVSSAETLQSQNEVQTPLQKTEGVPFSFSFGLLCVKPGVT